MKVGTCNNIIMKECGFNQRLTSCIHKINISVTKGRRKIKINNNIAKNFATLYPKHFLIWTYKPEEMCVLGQLLVEWSMETYSMSIWKRGIINLHHVNG